MWSFLVSPAEATPLPGWTHRVELTVRPAGLGADVADLPVLVSLGDDLPDGFDPAEVSSADGVDVQFVDDAGAALPFDRDAWTATGRSAFWVRLPLTPAYGTASFWMYWGNPSASDLTDPTATWSPWNVWHLQSCAGVCLADAGSLFLNSSGLTSGPALAGDGALFGTSGDLEDLSVLGVPLSISLAFSTAGWIGSDEVLLACKDFAIARCGNTDGVGLRTDSSCGVAGGAVAGRVHQLELDLERDGQSYELYLDGALVEKNTLPAPLLSVSALHVGAPSPVYDASMPRFSGWIDQLVVDGAVHSGDQALAGWHSAMGDWLEAGPVEVLQDTDEPPDTGTPSTGGPGGSDLPSTGGTVPTAGTSPTSVSPGQTFEGGTRPEPPVGYRLSGGSCGCSDGPADRFGGLLVLIAVVRRRR